MRHPSLGTRTGGGHGAASIAVAADDRVEPARVRQIAWTPADYAASLAVILLGYHELHSALFGTTLT